MVLLGIPRTVCSCLATEYDIPIIKASLVSHRNSAIATFRMANRDHECGGGRKMRQGENQKGRPIANLLVPRK